MASRRGWGRVRKLPSKRWQASYIGPDLNRHNAPGTFSAKVDAEGWLSRERDLVATGEWTPPATRQAHKQPAALTFETYSKRWLDQKTKLTERTREGYERLLRLHINPKLGDLPLKAITPPVVREWHAGLGTAHPTRNAHAYGLLHAVLETAFDDDLIPANPCRLKGQMSTQRKREPVLLEPAEVADLADVIEPRLRALILIAAWCGPRFGEVSELRRKDLSEDCSILTISRAVTHRVTSTGRCHIGATKNKTVREVVVPPHIRPDLLAHLDEHVGSAADSLLFVPANGGCHLNDKVFRDSYFAPACKKIGRDGGQDAAKSKRRPVVHDLRHFNASIASTRTTATLAEVQARLGHTTVDAAMRYQHVVRGRDAEIAAELSALANSAHRDA